jgi:hypothetical protein
MELRKSFYSVVNTNVNDLKDNDDTSTYVLNSLSLSLFAVSLRFQNASLALVLYVLYNFLW